VHVAGLKTARHRNASFLEQLNLNAWMAASVQAKEARKRIFNDLGRSGDAENSGLAFFERPSSLVEGFEFSQQAAAEPKQAFALRGEFEVSTDPIK
jgi:hypothetical protein